MTTKSQGFLVESTSGLKEIIDCLSQTNIRDVAKIAPVEMILGKPFTREEVQGLLEIQQIQEELSEADRELAEVTKLFDQKQQEALRLRAELAHRKVTLNQNLTKGR